MALWDEGRHASAIEDRRNDSQGKLVNGTSSTDVSILWKRIRDRRTPTATRPWLRRLAPEFQDGELYRVGNDRSDYW
jgi:hypothetical protein